jgi:hypothetical protein
LTDVLECSSPGGEEDLPESIPPLPLSLSLSLSLSPSAMLGAMLRQVSTTEPTFLSSHILQEVLKLLLLKSTDSFLGHELTNSRRRAWYLSSLEVALSHSLHSHLQSPWIPGKRDDNFFMTKDRNYPQQ